MNRSVLTLGIILSLGTVGCAGFGVQQSSSLGAQLQKERGLDELWSSTEEAPTQGLEAPRYAEQGLSNLWNDRVTGVETVGDDGSVQTPNRGDLWNPAAVSRSWEINEGRKASPLGGLLFGDSSGGGIWY